MLELYKPRTDELWFKEKMLADGPTMAYNHAYGGTIPFPKERWVGWAVRWLQASENQRFYRYLKLGNEFIGETAYRFDEERQIYIADIIIFAPYRGRGYGRSALKLLCEAAKKNGIDCLWDDIAADNSSVAMFINFGFREICRNEEYITLKIDL